MPNNKLLRSYIRNRRTGLQNGGQVPHGSQFLRDRFEDASGIGALRRIGGLGRAGGSRVARILSKLGRAALGAPSTHEREGGGYPEDLYLRSPSKIEYMIRQ